MLTEGRSAKIKDLVRWRQHDLTVVLENIHDPHNIGAIVRTCDAAGIGKIHVIYSQLGENSHLKYVGKKASRGAAKWVNVFFYNEIAPCIQNLKADGFKIFATHLGEKSESIYNVNFIESLALVFGNEKDGISPELLAYCDGNINIPMFGMVQSLNVSNAVAIILYEAVRQRVDEGKFDKPFDPSSSSDINTLRNYISKSRPRIARRNISIIDNYIEALVQENSTRDNQD